MAGGEHQAGFDPGIPGALPVGVLLFVAEFEGGAQWSSTEQVRDRALCLARLATAYATTGEPEQAYAVIVDLIAIADGLGSARVAAQIAELRTALTPWRRSPSHVSG
jgi:hypothetical protein